MLRYILTGFSTLLLWATATAQGQPPVLKSQLYFRYIMGNNTITDSTVFIHNTGHASTASLYDINYLHTRGYRYDTAITFLKNNDDPYYQRNRLVQTFNSQDSVTSWEYQLYDTFSHKYTPYQRSRYTYNFNHLPDSVITYTMASSWVPQTHTIYTYDANLRMKEIKQNTSQSWPLIWVPSSHESFTYNSNGDKTAHKTKRWDTKTGLPDSIIHTYTYDAFHHLLTDSLFAYNMYYSVAGYAYDSKGMLMTDSTFNIYNQGSKRTYSYDANGNRVQLQYETWDAAVHAFEYKTRLHYYYNAYNQLTKHSYDIWYNSGWLPSADAYVMHYQHPVGVADIARSHFPIKLYPVPATHMAHLEIDIDAPQHLSVAVLDMQGRVVKQFTDKAEGHYKKSIIVQDMPAGQYMLQVKTNSETAVKNFTVIH